MKDQIRKFLKSLSHDEPKDDDNLFDKGVLDSFGVLELIAFLEEKFKVQFEPADVSMENFQSLNSICQLIERIRNERS